MTSIIFIAGPTASGKSAAAFLLAKRLGAEIISCDSMLVYRQPHILTAKPSPDMLDKIKHHFVDIISVEDKYNVYDYYRRATAKISSLLNNNIPVIVCGGTGLYMKALLDGIFEGPDSSPELRFALEREAEDRGAHFLYERLKSVDPESAAAISANDARRIIRALEVYGACGTPLSRKKLEARGLYSTYNVKIFGLRIARDALYERIERRVEAMFDAGAVDEVRKLLSYKLSLTASKIIGIKEIAGYLQGDISLDASGEMMKKNTRNYAKRQMTWFNKDKRIEWVDVDKLSPEQISEKIFNSV